MCEEAVCVVFFEWVVPWIDVGAVLVDFRCFSLAGVLCADNELACLVVLHFWDLSVGV